jgi:hypothetical protein
MSNREQAKLSAQSVIDRYFVDAGYGCMDDATKLAEAIAAQLDQEGRLS